MDWIYIIIAIFLVIIITHFYIWIASVHKKRSPKNKIPREQLIPIMDETSRLFASYLLIFVTIAMVPEVLSKVISNSIMVSCFDCGIIVYTGIIMVLMCYGVFDYKEKRKVYVFFYDGEKNVKIRKIILFSFIAVFSVINIFCKYLEYEIELLRFVNETYIVCIIAVDRVINLLYDVCSKDKNEKNNKE